MNYSSVYIAGSSPRRSRWMDARNSLTDFLRITVPAGLHGTFTIEGSNDAATIAAELALNPAYSDDSAASFVDVTGTCTFDSSLTVTGGEVINGTYGGSYDYIRVRWVQTSGTGDIIVVVSDSSMGGGGNVVVTPSDNPYDIRHFLPVGETLSASNWRQAFENAKQAAFAAATNDTAFPAAANGAVPQIFVPEGTWPVEGTPLTLTMGDGDLTNAVRPGLAGAWQYGTVFVDKLAGGASHDGAIRMGYSSDSAYLYSGGRLSDFTVVSDDQNKDGVGIHVKDVIDFKLSNVTIRGYSTSTDIDKRGINLIIDSSFPTLSPNQHVQLDNVWCAYGLTGAKLDVIAQLNIKQLNTNGNYVASVTYDNCFPMVWEGGNTQYGGGGEIVSGTPLYGVPGFAIRGGFNKVVSSGATGTVGASSGSTATLTLPGIGQDFTNIGCMVRLKGVAGSYNNTLVEIIDVPANNQVTVNAKNLTAESNVTWELRTQRGGDVLKISGIYYEGGSNTLGAWFMARMSKGGNQPYVVLTSNVVQNIKYFQNVRDAVQVTNQANLDGSVSGSYLRHSLVATDFPISRIDADGWSFTRLVAREADNSPFSGNQSVGGRLVSACKQAGAVEIWDARQNASLSLVSTAVHSWTGLLNSTVLNPVNSGVYPTLLAADSAMGADCVKFTGNLNASLVDNLEGSISSSVLPSVPHNMSMLVIARVLASDDQSGIGGGVRRVGLADMTASRRLEVVAGDGGYIPLNRWGSLDYSSTTQTAVSGAAGETGVTLTDATPRCIVTGPSSSTPVNSNSSMFLEASLQSDGVECIPAHADTINLWPGGNNVDLYIGGPNAGQRGTLVVAYIAVFPRALGVRTRHALLDIAKTEFTKLVRA